MQLLKLHRWVGSILAIFLLCQGLTGAALVFRDEFERMIHPALIVAPAADRVTLQVMLDTVRAAHPEAVVARAEIPEAADQAVYFKLKVGEGDPKIFTAVDPYRGIIVRDGGLSDWPTEWLFVLHDAFFLGETGHLLIGLEGLALLFLAIAGLVAWWPAKGRFRQGFRVKLGASADLRWRTLHRALGAGVAAVLLVSATTGALMVWKEELRDVLKLAVAVERKPAPKVAEEEGRAVLPVDALVAKARAAYGGAPLRQVRFSSGGRVVAVYLEGRDTIRADGTAQFYFNGYDGTELGRYVAGRMPAASEFIDWLYTVHTGLWGGFVTRMIMVLAGMLLLGLSLTGPWLWWSRASKRRGARARRTGAIVDPTASGT